jgi:hypothetical protein
VNFYDSISFHYPQMTAYQKERFAHIAQAWKELRAELNGEPEPISLVRSSLNPALTAGISRSTRRRSGAQ